MSDIGESNTPNANNEDEEEKEEEDEEDEERWRGGGGSWPFYTSRLPRIFTKSLFNEQFADINRRNKSEIS